ncbi:MAG: sodium:proton antiporter, partial [Oscillospiraceae bacterium]|nr:sodium:proton antiporter [Oscillospiraceae bacterium]
MLPLYQNIPFLCILLAMVSGVITSLIRSSRAALGLCLGMLSACCAANLYLAVTLFAGSESFRYMLGHFPAPWGNELRAGPLEAMLAAAFALVMILCILGGLDDIKSDILPKKQPFYFLMLDLLWASLLVMLYTNDIFTAYVFIEINTIASCAIVMAKDTGHTNMATIRYMIMSQLGSGMFLLSISLLYGITGHLLFPQLQQGIALLDSTGSYALPLTVLTGLMVLGLSIKAALYPFHDWLPSAHGNATTASSAILSGLVLK